MRKSAIERFIDLLRGELGPDFHSGAWSGINLEGIKTVVCTFPRSGTTWMLQMLLEILNQTSPCTANRQEVLWPDDLLNQSLMFADRFRPPHERKTTKTLKSGEFKIIKTHSEAKYVPRLCIPFFYVARDPLEVLDSSFRFFNSIFKCINPVLFEKTGGVSSATWVEHFLTENFFFGDWCDHIADWWERRHVTNITFMTFRQMKESPEEIIDRISNILGITTGQIDRTLVLDRCSFTSMRQDPRHNLSVSTNDQPLSLIDKGGVDILHLDGVFQSAVLAIDEFCRRKLTAAGSDFPYDEYIVAARPHPVGHQNDHLPMT